MATVPAPHSFTSGEVVTAANLNASGYTPALWALGLSGGAKPHFVGYQTVQQTGLSTSGATAVTLDTEAADTDNGHSTTTNTARYTANTAGWYEVHGTCGVSPVTSGDWVDGMITVNGVTGLGGGSSGGIFFVDRSFSAGSLLNYLSVSGEVYLNVGDYVELAVFPQGGTSLVTDITNRCYPRLTVRWVSAT
jgi:hypothetical protein